MVIVWSTICWHARAEYYRGFRIHTTPQVVLIYQIENAFDLVDLRAMIDRISYCLFVCLVGAIRIEYHEPQLAIGDRRCFVHYSRVFYINLWEKL